MASKTHCDNCDATPAVDGIHEKIVVLEHPKALTLMGMSVQIDVEFRRQPPHYDDSRSSRMDLCNKCQLEALELLVKRLQP